MYKKDYFKIVRDGYDLIAGQYDRDRDKFYHDEDLNIFISHLPQNPVVLDIGCGAADPVGRYLVDHGCAYTGIDFSEGMLRIAKKNCPEGSFLKMNMVELAFDDNSFDGVTAFYSIIHLERKYHLDLFKNIKRILKPGGVMLICLGPDAWEAVDEYYDIKMFWSHYSPLKSLDLVKRAELEIISDEIKEINSERHYWILARKKS